MAIRLSLESVKYCQVPVCYMSNSLGPSRVVYGKPGTRCTYHSGLKAFYVSQTTIHQISHFSREVCSSMGPLDLVVQAPPPEVKMFVRHAEVRGGDVCSMQILFGLANDPEDEKDTLEPTRRMEVKKFGCMCTQREGTTQCIIQQKVANAPCSKRYIV